MNMATAMKKVTDDIRKSRRDIREAEKFRIENEQQRQHDEVPRARDRESFVRHLISQDKERVKDFKPFFAAKKREVKHIFNEVHSFLGDIQDEMAETHRIWRSISKGGKHFEGGDGKVTASHKRSKSKKKKRRSH